MRDQESTFGRVNRKAINEFNSNKPGIRRRTPSPEKRRRTPQRYDDDGDARMTAMPPPHSSETNQRRRAPTSSSLVDDAPPSAAQEARDDVLSGLSLTPTPDGEGSEEIGSWLSASIQQRMSFPKFGG